MCAPACARVPGALAGGEAGAPVKWQVQNVVGGGSLYGVSDTQQVQQQQQQQQQASTSGAQAASRELLTGRASSGPFSAAYLAEQQQGAGAAGAARQGGGLGGGSASSSTASLATAGAAGGGGGGGAGGGAGGGGRVLEGVDIIYLKNVVLKFLEAALAGRVPERDALLPAVATLLQVRSPEGVTLLP